MNYLTVFAEDKLIGAGSGSRVSGSDAGKWSGNFPGSRIGIGVVLFNIVLYF